MKRCPQCGRDYNDPTLSFCLDDGAGLLDGPASMDEPRTAILPDGVGTAESPTRTLDPARDESTKLYSENAGVPDTKPDRKKAIAVTAVLGILVVAAIAFGAYWYYSGDAPNQISSIAVMPFEDDSNSADSAYLSDGLVESLIYRLSKIESLKVSPSSSVFRYKGKQDDSVSAGKELGVEAVMTGRIAQRGDDLILSVELVNVRDGKLLWGERYNRKMAELLATQREITNEIVAKLQIQLKGKAETDLQKSYTSNSEAYELFLKGHFHFEKRTKADIEKGIDYYNQALKLDKDFALAYVGIANAYQVMPSYGYIAPKEAGPKAMAAARKALEIDPDLPEAHAAVATVAASLFWDWETAEREYGIALKMNPNDAFTHFKYGNNYLQPMGRTNEAVAEVKRALELEPLSIVFGAVLADAYLENGQVDKAFEQIRATNDLEPGHPTTAYWLMLIYVAKGMCPEAVQIAEKRLTKMPDDQDSLSIAGVCYAKTGDRAKAEEIIAKFRKLSETQYILRSYIAQIYGVLGEKDKAFKELEQAAEEKDYFVTTMSNNPIFDDLRDDPRFAGILRSAGFPERR